MYYLLTQQAVSVGINTSRRINAQEDNQQADYQLVMFFVTFMLYFVFVTACIPNFVRADVFFCVRDIFIARHSATRVPYSLLSRYRVGATSLAYVAMVSATLYFLYKKREVVNLSFIFSL